LEKPKNLLERTTRPVPSLGFYAITEHKEQETGLWETTNVKE
jgi:hypothetical protein